MIRTAILRGGLLVATTALAGTAFAGSAAASTGGFDPQSHIMDKLTFNVTGTGGAGGVTGLVSQDNCIASNTEPLAETNAPIGAIGGVTSFTENDDAIQCVVVTGDATGGPGLMAE